MNSAHPELSFPSQHSQGDLFVVTTDGEIEAGISKTKLTQDNFVKKWREPRIDQPDFVPRGIEAEPKRRLKQREGRGRGPSLRRASDRIQRRTPPTPALETAKQLR